MNLIELYENNEFSKVIKEWDTNQYQISTDSDVGFIVAASQFRLGNFEQACKICEDLEGVLGSNANFLALYAAILRRLMLLQRAEEVFEMALSIDPKAEDVRNNYSNLLIDLERYDEAEAILKRLIDERPGYDDAKTNLMRCQELKSARKEKQEKKEKDADSAFGDPLDKAFEIGEVTQCGSKPGSLTATVENLLPDASKSDMEEADVEMLELASKQIKAQQFNGALELLGKLRERRGMHSSLYQKASEALIGLEKYREAEIYGLITHLQGEKTIANLLNLASLSAMRKDQHMANYWLMEAKKVDSENELYIQCRELLFPEGKARDKDAPFT